MSKLQVDDRYMDSNHSGLKLCFIVKNSAKTLWVDMFNIENLQKMHKQGCHIYLIIRWSFP